MRKAIRLLAALLALLLLFSGCGLSAVAPESKNGEAAMRPNTIENYELKVFLQKQDDQAKENLFALYHAITNFEATCYLPYPMPQDRVQGLLALLCYECPELFQVDLTQPTSYHSYEGQADVIAVDFPYCMEKTTYDALLADARQALSQFETAGMTLLEAEKYIYDILCQQITYSTATTHCANVYGALVEGQAKCDGISKAMKWAMENAGFSCMCVGGQPYNGGIGHAWNIIPVDGHYYHLDLTSDVQSGTQHDPFYPAYNVSADFMVGIYAPDSYFDIPEEHSIDASYHAEKGNFFAAGANWKNAVKKLFKDAHKTGDTFTVQFATQTDYNTCKDSLETLFREAAREAGIQRWSWGTTYIDQYYLLSVKVQ